MFKFLHAADIHLDSPLRGLGRSEDLPADEIRGASRRALDNLVKLAIDERVKFVLIAGDVYDGDWKDYNTGLWFVGRMARLREAGIKVFLIRGNHDAANKMTAHLPLPDNVHSFPTDKVSSKRIDELDVIVHGQGFAQAAVEHDLAAEYPPADRGRLNIWMLHTSAGGSSEHARYAPCTVDALRAKGYGYWALGHVHNRDILSQGDAWVAFPGNIQGRHVKESGAKGCLIVTVDDARQIVDVDFRALDVLRWATCDVDATGIDVGDDLYPRFEAVANRLLDLADDRPVAVRVVIAGVCAAHERMASRLPQVVAELRATALGIGRGRLWIEKVKLATTAESDPALDDPTDALGVLIETIDGYRHDPDTLRPYVPSELSDLRDRLVAERDEFFEGLDFDDPVWLRAMIDGVRPLLLSKIRGASGG